MSIRNALVLFLALSTMSLLVGCGSSNNSATAPPTGGFTTSSLSGTYVFSFSGLDITPDNGAQNESFFAVAGTLVASNGSFSSGSVIDLNDPAIAAGAGANSSVQLGLPVTGSYSVTADGRGTGTLNVSVNNVPVQIGIDFVLSSPSGGLITRFDNFGSGSGSINLQTAGITQSNLQGSYAFGLAGADSDSNSLGAVGAFSLDVNGNVVTGSGSQADFNDNGSSTNLSPLALGGTVLAGSPGTAQLTTSATGFSALSFDVWVVDSTHLKFIETDSTAILAGDAYVSTGQTSFPGPSPLAFTMIGDDVDGLPLAAGGLLTSDGVSQITGGLEDVNDEGDVAEAPSINGNFTSSGARTVLTLNGIYNGAISGTSIVPGAYTFAAYPYTGGIELLEIDNAGITGGAAYVQTPSTLTPSQGYALNLSGAYLTENSEEEEVGLEADIIAQFSTNTSGGVSSGLYDANNLDTGLVPDASLGASTAAYSNDSNGDGRGTASFPNLQTNSNNSVIGALDFTFYTINSSSLVFIETDGGQVATGTLLLQSASGSAGAIRPPFSMVRPAVRAHGALRKKQK